MSAARRSPLLFAAALLAQAAPSWAQTAEEQARAAFAEGVAAEKDGRGEDACAAYARSLGFVRELGPLTKVARCHEARGELDAARAAFRELVQRLPKDAPERPDAERASAEIELRMPRVSLRFGAPEPASILIDGRKISSPYVGLSLDPGEHEVVFERAGKSLRRQLSLVERQRGEVDLSGRPSAPDAAPRFPSGLGIGGFVSGGVGLAALAGAIATGVLSLDKEAAYDACTGGCQALADEGDMLLVANGVLWGVTIAGLGTGLTLVLVDALSGSSEPRTALTIGPSGASLRVRF